MQNEETTRPDRVKTALKQETYNLSDLKHDLKSLRVCRTWRLGLGLTVVTNLNNIGSNNSKFTNIILSP